MPRSDQNRKGEMGKEYQEETSTGPRGVETRYLTSWCQGVLGADVVQKTRHGKADLTRQMCFSGHDHGIPWAGLCY